MKPEQLFRVIDHTMCQGRRIKPNLIRVTMGSKYQVGDLQVNQDKEWYGTAEAAGRAYTSSLETQIQRLESILSSPIRVGEYGWAGTEPEPVEIAVDHVSSNPIS